MNLSTRSASEPITVYGITGSTVSEIDHIQSEFMPKSDAGLDLLIQYEKARNSVDGVIFSQGRTNLGCDMT
jgi:hypothetical protein